MKKLLIISLLIMCSGCSNFVYVHDRYPIYEMPPKAIFELVSNDELKALSKETRIKIIDTVRALKIEVIELRIKLISYNKYATKKNKQNRKKDNQ